MKITTQYDVGYQFWVPRVVKQVVIITKVFEGQEWRRQEETLEIKTKHKQVKRIDISVDSTGDVSVKYYCVNVGEVETDWPTIYSPQDMIFTDEQTARNLAREWRETHGCEYYGPTGQDDDEE
jgi:hypothetical protein